MQMLLCKVEALAVSSSPPPSTLKKKVPAGRRNTYMMTFSPVRPSFFFKYCCCSALSPPSAVVVSEAVRFAEALKNGNLVPLFRCIFSDQLTPVLAYRCLTREGDWESPSFLFESVDDQEFQGRYSVVGAWPTMEIVAKGNRVTIMDHEEGRRTEELLSEENDPMEIPWRIMKRWKWSRPSQSQSQSLLLITDHDLPPVDDAFCGGWLGYFSYDTSAERRVEKNNRLRVVLSGAPPEEEEDRNLPDVHLGLYDDVVVFDHVEKKAYVIHWVQLDRYPTVEKAYDDGMKRLDVLVSRVQDIDPPRLASGYVKLDTCSSSSKMSSSMTSEQGKDAYNKQVAALQTGKEHIQAIALSQRFQRRTLADPFEVYRALRVVNPSPYMAYLQARGCVVVASSPEILTRVKKVTGEVHNHFTCWDALRAASPVVAVSGAPKVKEAMQFMDQLEVAKRAPYHGRLGGMSFSGNTDMALALGTIVFPTSPRYDTMYSYKGRDMRREWVAHIQAGTGILPDSKPNQQQKVCENKVAALVSAIHLAESTFLQEYYN